MGPPIKKGPQYRSAVTVHRRLVRGLYQGYALFVFEVINTYS